MRTDGSVFQFRQVTQDRFLFRADLHGDLKNDPQQQISRPAAPRIRHSAATNPYDLSGLCAGVNVVLSLSFEARDFDVRAECRLRVGNRNVANQVLAFTPKQRMLDNVNFHKDVSGRPAMLTWFAFTSESQKHSGVDAGGNGDVFVERFQDSTGAAAVAAFFADDRSLTAAGWAAGLHSEKAL
jgi:hypothetical protein